MKHRYNLQEILSSITEKFIAKLVISLIIAAGILLGIEVYEYFGPRNLMGFEAIYIPNKIITDGVSSTIKKVDNSQKEGLILWLLKSDITQQNVQIDFKNSISTIEEAWVSVREQDLYPDTKSLTINGGPTCEEMYIPNCKIFSNLLYTFIMKRKTVADFYNIKNVYNEYDQILRDPSYNIADFPIKKTDSNLPIGELAIMSKGRFTLWILLPAFGSFLLGITVTIFGQKVRDKKKYRMQYY